VNKIASFIIIIVGAAAIGFKQLKRCELKDKRDKRRREEKRTGA
jgi:hypothetical protein